MSNDGVDSGKAAHKVLKSKSLGPDYFRDVYQRHADPWNFESSPYEAAKYTATLESLPRRLYPRGLEVGCSIGVLTRRLAARCGTLLSVDVSVQALAKAEARCADLRNVVFELMQIPNQEPPGSFDLVVISEVAYYWDARDLGRAMDLIAAHQMPGAHLILVHWTPEVPDYPLTGDQVHDAWLAQAGYRHLHHRREEQFRLDVLERTG